MAAVGREVPIQVQVTIELTGRMLPGTEIGAALAALDAMRPDVIGLNCATGPAEMSEHLRHLVAARAHADLVPPQRRACRRWSTARCTTTSRPSSWPTPQRASSPSSACTSSAAAAAPRPSTSRARRRAVPRPHARRAHARPRAGRGVDLQPFTPFDQDVTVPVDRRAHQRQRLEEVPRGDARRPTGTPACRWRASRRRKARTSSTSASTTSGRDGSRRHGRDRQSRFATQATVPLDARLHRAAGDRGRAAVASAAGPSSTRPTSRTARRQGTRLDRFLHARPRVRRRRRLHCCIDEEGQARDVEWKLRVAHRIHDLAVDRYGLEPSDLFFDPLDAPARHRHRGEPRRRHGHDRGHPPHQGRAAGRAHRCSACRTCQLRPQARRPATSSTRCSCTSAARPGSTRPSCTRRGSCRSTASPTSRCKVCLDLIYDRRDAATGYDPLQALLGALRGRRDDRRR